MQKVKLESVNDAVISQEYKEIITSDQEQNKSRAETSLAILPAEAQKNIIESCKYSSYFPNPITKPFMRQYILGKIEFPTKGSELAQSLTELNVRIDNLFNDAYSYEKARLEAEAFELDIEALEQQLKGQMEGSVQYKKTQNQMALMALEQKNKEVSLNKIKLAAMARYNEAMGWKGCVEDIMAEMQVSSLDDVDFNRIRMDEMAAKIKKWGELAAQGSLEMTPSKFNAIHDNVESFVAGQQEMQAKLKELERLQIGKR